MRSFVPLLALFVFVQSRGLSKRDAPVSCDDNGGATDPNFECSVCPKLFQSDCDENDLDCLSEEQNPYWLGYNPVGVDNVNNWCSMWFSCPEGTTSKVNLTTSQETVTGLPVMTPYCRESGLSAGQWFYNNELNDVVPIDAIFCEKDTVNDNCGNHQSGEEEEVTPEGTTTQLYTTTTDPNYPCSVCQKLYTTDISQIFLNGEEIWFPSVPEDQVAPNYILGHLEGNTTGDSDWCQLNSAICPFGSTAVLTVFDEQLNYPLLPGPPIVSAFCKESGPDAGKWMYQFPPAIPSPIQVAAVTCRYTETDE